MSERSVEHGTLVIERTFEAPPARVFEAWAHVEARKRWSPPSADTVIVYESADFREGGGDVVYCGAPGDLRFKAEVHYFDIVAGQRIVFAEEVSENAKRMALALITVTLAPAGKATAMRFTAQIAALDGSNMIAGYNEGWSAAFDNLAKDVRQGRS